MSIAVSNGVDSCIFQNVPGPSFRAAASSSSCWALWRLGNEREAMLAENTVQPTGNGAPQQGQGQICTKDGLLPPLTDDSTENN
jgi:hypothetical protein